MLRLCSNFDKSSRKYFLYVEALELFLNFDDSELEEGIDFPIIKELLKVFDVCRRSDVVHTKVFQILRKIPLKIAGDKSISNTLKNFCYYCKIEKNSGIGKGLTNVSAHFLYQLMEFFDFAGENEYDRLLLTWLDELKELFGKKLLMDSDMSDFEESQIKNSGLEIKNDFSFFGTDSEKDTNFLGENKPKGVSFDFTQPIKSLNKSNSSKENNEFGLSAGEFEGATLTNSYKKKTALDDFDFDDFAPNKQYAQESPIKKNGTSK